MISISYPHRPSASQAQGQIFVWASFVYAAEEYPELDSVITHGFEQDGDVERALSLIHASSGISRTQSLAQAYAEKAKEVLGALPASEARVALDALTDRDIEQVW